MTEMASTGQRIYDLINDNPRSEYRIVFETMRAVMDPSAYRVGLAEAYSYALAQFDGEEWTVAGVIRKEIEAQGWSV